ncbi:MAG: cupin domain-containing protein [Candidatus Nitrosopelagicus sp.]|jgi:mannose-6-phosphate isomerase-like protein (cupin superfamily)|nr:cupin domain-containing protein [Candidatus Nitrosopelagicus sp.]
MISKKIESLDSFRGGEGSEIRSIFDPNNTLNGIRYSLAHSIILSGKSSKPHKMKSAEVFFILEGEGIIHVDEQSEKVERNHSIYIPPLSKQYLENTGSCDLHVLCIVDPAWKHEDEIVS